MQLQYVQLITDKTVTADLSSAWCIHNFNSLPLHKFRQKLANSDITKEVLNCTASVAADSIVDAISFSRHIVL